VSSGQEELGNTSETMSGLNENTNAACLGLATVLLGLRLRKTRQTEG
jgi:hypothetical protein